MAYIDPFYLHHIVSANAELASALENLDSEDPDYLHKQNDLIVATAHLEKMIKREVAPELMQAKV